MSTRNFYPHSPALHEGSFTELFCILKNEIAKNSELLLDKEKLKTAQEYASQGVDVLLRGMQEVGFLLSSTMQDNPEILKLLSSIGFFISSISNLVEALNTLRNDLDYLSNTGN